MNCYPTPSRNAVVTAGLLLLTALLLAACRSDPPAPAPEPASAALPTRPSPPEPADHGNATIVVERDFAVPLIPLRTFLADGDRIAAAMEPTERMPVRVSTEAAAGVWPEAGAVRRVNFADGSHAWERVLANDFPHRLRWQTWGHTGPAGTHVAYTLGDHAWSAPGDGRSRLVWTHTLHPNHPFKRFLMQRFADRELAPRLAAAVEEVATAAKRSTGSPGARGGAE